MGKFGHLCEVHPASGLCVLPRQLDKQRARLVVCRLELARLQGIPERCVVLSSLQPKFLLQSFATFAPYNLGQCNL